MINHSLLFAATGASLTINPFKSLVSLGDLCVWPGHCQSLGTLIAAWTVGRLFLVAVLHAYASARQRGGGRGYYLKWDRK